MQKKPSVEYKLPDMTQISSERADRGNPFPDGEFLCEVYKLRPKLTRAQKLAFIGEFRIVEIINQEPTQKYKSQEMLQPATLGCRRDHYFALGEQYGYGEVEWAQLLDALEVPVAERNEAQDAFLGEENLACGLQVRIRRQGPKTYFNKVAKKVA